METILQQILDELRSQRPDSNLLSMGAYTRPNNGSLSIPASGSYTHQGYFTCIFISSISGGTFFMQVGDQGEQPIFAGLKLLLPKATTRVTFRNAHATDAGTIDFSTSTGEITDGRLNTTGTITIGGGSINIGSGPGYANVAASQVSVTTTSGTTIALPARAARRELILVNTSSSNSAYFSGTSGVTTSTGHVLPANATLSIPYTGDVYLISTATITVSILEAY